MQRRDFLKSLGTTSAWIATRALVGSTIVIPALMKQAEAATGLPLASLHASLSSNDALILIPTDQLFSQYQASFNLRKILVPQIRVLVKNAQAIATTLQWIRANNVPFASRGGGHSYEGFSQSSSVVIDTRLINQVQVNASTGVTLIGGGSSLGNAYSNLTAHNLIIPAGSCPPVGVAGHTQGGGFGLLGRAYGLACDALTGAQLVNAEGQILNVNQNENADLFWALRGGGGGSFGIVSQFQFQAQSLDQVAVFGMDWNVNLEKAIQLMQNWQSWIQQASSNLTCIFRLSKSADGMINLHCAGQTIDSETKLKSDLNSLCLEQPRTLRTQTLSPNDAVRHFAGNDTGYTSVYMKAKSDYVVTPLSTEGMRAVFQGLLNLPTGALCMICDSYGGAIAKTASDATAFFHRNALYSIQYYSEWQRAADSDHRVSLMTQFYNSLRPYMSGQAYLNYCDLDLQNWAQAYWGDNLARLKQVKAAYDPHNIFRHAQSVPL